MGGVAPRPGDVGVVVRPFSRLRRRPAGTGGPGGTRGTVVFAIGSYIGGDRLAVDVSTGKIPQHLVPFPYMLVGERRDAEQREAIWQQIGKQNQTFSAVQMGSVGKPK